MLDLQESLIHDANGLIVSFSKGIHWTFILIHHRHDIILLQDGHDIILYHGHGVIPSPTCFIEGSPFNMLVANSEVGLEKATACYW
jgi:hypothetical protein